MGEGPKEIAEIPGHKGHKAMPAHSEPCQLWELQEERVHQQAQDH